MQNDKIWVYNEVPEALADRISKETGVSRLVAKVLINRGIDEKEQVSKFLNPSIDDLIDPFLMKDMDKAVERVSAAVRDNEKIILYGDYDVDGVTSITILYSFLRSLGASVNYYIPDRLEEGYGLSMDAACKVVKAKASLVITVDCGITSLDEVEYLNNNMDVIVTDHHECKDNLPEAYAVLNPCRPDCAYPFKELAGVGVVYKLVTALCMKMGLGEAYRKYLDLVALGTVADVVPLVGENRVIVKRGLPKIENTSNIGLKALISVSGLEGKPINSYGLSFVLAPRVNAAGRLGDAEKAVRLFISEDNSKALKLALELDQENKHRQNTEAEILEQVLSIVETEVDLEKEKVIVAAGEAWHHGVIGIVASRVVERYHRPCILISVDEDGMGKGSGRSFEGFNLFKSLLYCESLLEKYGGHELAAGLSLRAESIPAFRSLINDYADTVLSKDDMIPRLRVDVKVNKDDISLKNVKEIEMLAPFGAGNPAPLFACEGLRIDNIRTVGEKKHLKMKLAKEGFLFDAIGFNMGGLANMLECNDILDAVFNLGVNTWNSMQTVQFNLKNIRIQE